MKELNIGMEMTIKGRTCILTKVLVRTTDCTTWFEYYDPETYNYAHISLEEYISIGA